MEMHFWNRDHYKTFEDAKSSGALYTCDAPLDEDQFDRWGFEGGILCDAMQAVFAALRCAGVSITSIEATITDGDKIVGNWRD